MKMSKQDFLDMITGDPYLKEEDGVIYYIRDIPTKHKFRSPILEDVIIVMNWFLWRVPNEYIICTWNPVALSRFIRCHIFGENFITRTRARDIANFLIECAIRGYLFGRKKLSQEILKSARAKVQQESEKNPGKYPEYIFPAHSIGGQTKGFSVVEATPEQTVNGILYWHPELKLKYMPIYETAKIMEQYMKSK